MKPLFRSTVFRKYLMGLSGLGLVGFVVLHLLGNLTLYSREGIAFNHYAESLHRLGPLLIVAEVGLVGMVLLHIVTALRIRRESSVARPISYGMANRSKGGESRSSFASRNMIVTGLSLLIFLVVHIKQFKFGPGMDQGYIAEIDGEWVRDLNRVVVESFQSPTTVLFYVFIMILLGAHLRHGFWSAFQSLGLAVPKYSKTLMAVGWVLATLLAAGFVGIPVWIFFRG